MAATEGRRGRATAAKHGGDKAEAVDKTTKRIVYEVVLSEDSGNFKFGKAEAAGRGEGQDR